RLPTRARAVAALTRRVGRGFARPTGCGERFAGGPRRLGPPYLVPPVAAPFAGSSGGRAADRVRPPGCAGLRADAGPIPGETSRPRPGRRTNLPDAGRW